MARPKRSVWAFLLLAMISMPGTVFLYRKVQQAVVRHEMKEKLEHALLQTIELPAAEVHWYKENKEIVVEGKLFDVKSQHRVPGTGRVVFTGLFDEEETDIVRKLSKLLQKKQQNADKRLLLAMCIFVYPAPDNIAMHRPWIQLQTDLHNHCICNLPAADLSIPSPPPKMWSLS